MCQICACVQLIRSVVPAVELLKPLPSMYSLGLRAEDFVRLGPSSRWQVVSVGVELRAARQRLIPVSFDAMPLDPPRTPHLPVHGGGPHLPSRVPRNRYPPKRHVSTRQCPSSSTNRRALRPVARCWGTMTRVHTDGTPVRSQPPHPHHPQLQATQLHLPFSPAARQCSRGSWSNHPPRCSTTRRRHDPPPHSTRSSADTASPDRTLLPCADVPRPRDARRGLVPLPREAQPRRR